MSKRTLVLGSSILALLVMVFLLHPFFTASQIPRGRLVPLSHSKIELYNTGDHSLFYHGFTKHDAILKIEVAPFAATPANQKPEICGTGLDLHEVKPGESVMLRLYLPHAAYTGKEVVVSCNLFGTASLWQQLKGNIANDTQPFASRSEGFFPTAPQKNVKLAEFASWCQPDFLHETDDPSRAVDGLAAAGLLCRGFVSDDSLRTAN